MEMTGQNYCFYAVIDEEAASQLYNGNYQFSVNYFGNPDIGEPTQTSAVDLVYFNEDQQEAYEEPMIPDDVSFILHRPIIPIPQSGMLVFVTSNWRIESPVIGFLDIVVEKKNQGYYKNFVARLEEDWEGPIIESWRDFMDQIKTTENPYVYMTIYPHKSY